MSIARQLIKKYKPQGQAGFLGAGHEARPVVSGPFIQTDPFIYLMDDILDKKDNIPVGGPHPHAGFETVSLLLQGSFGDEKHHMKEGDFEIMTAGSGIVHTETLEKKAKLRWLQLWLNLPKKDRWAAPRVQNMSFKHVPTSNEHGVKIHLYSGSLAGLTSPVQNYSPLIVANITINAGVTTVQQLPANYNTFLYVIEGSVKIGMGEKQLHKDEVGWLNLSEETSESDLKLTAGEAGVNFVLYAGKPTGDEIVSHGPFIADTAEEIQQLYQEYRRGKINHITTVPEERKIKW
ncbi:pirin family protein [Pontibacter sp. 13R65]|uniref:pirin family protein n=1 Tax=Pontibacter sp. 13R65 TaxID=3127458 RepID=UPI00301BC7DC